jgi:hypothetical protein
VDDRSHHRRVGTHRVGRQGRRARRGCRRLGHEAVPDRRAAGPAARAGQAGTCICRRSRRPVRRRRSRPSGENGDPRRRPRASDADRVADAGVPRPVSRCPCHSPVAAEGDLGERAGVALGVSPAVHGAAAEEARGGPCSPGAPVHGAGDGLPARERG